MFSVFIHPPDNRIQNSQSETAILPSSSLHETTSFPLCIKGYKKHIFGRISTNGALPGSARKKKVKSVILSPQPVASLRKICHWWPGNCLPVPNALASHCSDGRHTKRFMLAYSESIAEAIVQTKRLSSRGYVWAQNCVVRGRVYVDRCM